MTTDGMPNHYPNSGWLMKQALVSIERLREIPEELQSAVTKETIAMWDAQVQSELDEML